MASHALKCVLIFLVASELLILDTLGQLDNVPKLSQVSHSGDSSDGAKELQVNYQLHQPHRIVKRKSKIGRGFGFGKKGKSSSKPQSRDPYPKQAQPAYPQQPAYNPSYKPAGQGAPPAYPGTNSRPGYPGAPPPYPGTGGVGHPSYPAGPPPAYPGTGGAHHNMPAYPPAYPGHSQPGYGGQPSYGQPNYGMGQGMGYGNTGFGGKGFNSGGFGGGKGGGLSRTLGSAGFGAVAGTALGAYGGYKLGKMVGGLGRNGHYGYYDDYGKYIRCDPPKNIKRDPETNVTYIPLEEDFDKRCNYFDKRPPSYWGGYTNGAGNSMGNSHPINQLVGSIINFTIFENFHLVWDNVFALAAIAALLV